MWATSNHHRRLQPYLNGELCVLMSRDAALLRVESENSNAIQIHFRKNSSAGFLFCGARTLVRHVGQFASDSREYGPDRSTREVGSSSARQRFGQLLVSVSCERSWRH